MSTAVIGAPEFRARSGRTVRAKADGSVVFDHVNGYLGPEQVFDAEEFFQAKRDAGLRRWRCPTDPDYVVREIDRDSYGRRRVLVLNEATFETRDVNEVACMLDTPVDRAARAFFEAHPERKPWEDAEDGEVWVLVADEYRPGAPWYRLAGQWVSLTGNHPFPHRAFTITDGHRIWPEDAS